MENLGERLREARIDRGLTVQQVASQLNVAKSAVSFWENNINEPKARYIAALACLYEVSADYLLGLEK